MTEYDLYGIIGAGMACLAYLLLHARTTMNLRSYAFLNLMSCAFMGLSLVGQFNMGSLVMEVFFAVVSLWALFKDPSYAD